MPKYELIDHTADLGIRVKAETLEDLFVQSALAMFDVMAQKIKEYKPSDITVKKIKLEAFDENELLFDWLSALVYLSDAKKLVFVDFHVEQLSETILKVAAKGVSKDFFNIERDIKAVTYHQLEISKNNQGYQVEVIFDL